MDSSAGAGDASPAARDLNDRDRVAVGVQRGGLPARLAFSLDRTGRHTSRREGGGSLLDVRHGHGHDAVAGVVRIADYVQPAAIRHLPHHLGLVRDDVGGPGEEAFVPRFRRLEVADRDTSEENIDVHHLSLAAPATGYRPKRSKQARNRPRKTQRRWGVAEPGRNRQTAVGPARTPGWGNPVITG